MKRYELIKETSNKTTLKVGEVYNIKKDSKYGTLCVYNNIGDVMYIINELILELYFKEVK